jgi:diacylglycerol kinase family enzyme
MKIALIHNPASGRRVSPESLRAAITRQGHELVRVIEHHGEASALADPPAELVVAAGGDGTVADAMRAVAGRDVPLAILPVGTANNIAFTLGIAGPVEQLAAGWHHATARAFDVGVLNGPGLEGKQCVEGAGGGLVEACMSSIRRRPLRAGEPPPWALVRALRRYTQALARLRPRRWSLRLDGRPHEGDFLLVEVMNTRSVGPNLVFAPEASPFDGMFTIVTAGDSDRAALAAYIADRLAGREGRLDLASQTARCIDIVHPPVLHVDDELVQVPSRASISMRIQPGVVPVLVPQA